MKVAEGKLKEKEKEEAKCAAAEKGMKDNIATEEKKKKQLQKVIKRSFLLNYGFINCILDD